MLAGAGTSSGSIVGSIGYMVDSREARPLLVVTGRGRVKVVVHTKPLPKGSYHNVSHVHKALQCTVQLPTMVYCARRLLIKSSVLLVL